LSDLSFCPQLNSTEDEEGEEYGLKYDESHGNSSATGRGGGSGVISLGVADMLGDDDDL
jgi:hypothetical protein